MKRRKNTKIFLIPPILIIGLLGFSLLANLDLEKEKIKTNQTVLTQDDISLLQIRLGEVSTQSIVNTEVVFVESDQNEFEKFMDEEKPFGITATEKFTLETTVTLFDSSGKKTTASSFIDVQELKSLVSEQGQILDLGSIQIGFFSKTDIQNDMKVIGTVEIWLDDRLLATKKIFRNADGILTKNDPLFVGDYVSSTITKQVPQTFTFTFADEQMSQGKHSFYVIIKDVVAETVSDVDRKKFSWEGEYLAYQLKMELIESKMTVYDDKLREYISIFKNDGVVANCKVNNLNMGKYGKWAETMLLSASKYPDDLTILKDGAIIAVLSADKTRSTPNVEYTTKTSTHVEDCIKFTGLERNSKYVFRIAGKDYEKTTSLLQENFITSCIPVGKAVEQSDYSGVVKFLGDVCTSNISSEYDRFYSVEGEVKQLGLTTISVCGDSTSGVISQSLDYGFMMSPRPSVKSPVVNFIVDGELIKSMGGKTYCQYWNGVSKDKSITINIEPFTDTIYQLQNNVSGFGLYCEPNSASCVIIQTDKVPSYGSKSITTNIQESKSIECTAEHRGFHLGNRELVAQSVDPKARFTIGGVTYHDWGWKTRCNTDISGLAV